MLAWKGEGRTVPKIVSRRGTIVHRSKVVVAFPGGSGTSHMVIIAEDAGVKLIRAEELGDET